MDFRRQMPPMARPALPPATSGPVVDDDAVSTASTGSFGGAPPPKRGRLVSNVMPHRDDSVGGYSPRGGRGMGAMSQSWSTGQLRGSSMTSSYRGNGSQSPRGSGRGYGFGGSQSPRGGRGQFQRGGRGGAWRGRQVKGFFVAVVEPMFIYIYIMRLKKAS